jgi:hypothetical protein
MPQQNAPFSTRFLQSDGIPEYNALLDTNLGKRREFLLGNKKSLKLLQQTGAIARVEVKEENPNQYVVFMAEKNPSNTNKRVPLPTSGSGAPLVEKRSNKNAASLSEDVIKSSYATTTNTTHHSISPVFQPASLSSMTKKKAKTFNSLFRKPGVELPASLGISKSNEQVKDDEKDTREEKDVTAMMTHSVSSNALVMKKQQLQLHQKPRSAVMHRRSSPDLFVLPNVQSVSEIDELIRQKKNEVKRVNFEDRVTSKKKAITPTSTTLAPGSAPGSDPATTAAAAPGTGSSNATTTVAAPKGTVEHLLEHDGVYQSKIHKMKEQMTELEIQKNHLEK